jgi:hypothetical protein
MDRLWKDGDHDVFYFYNEEDGRVVGQINKIAHSKIWLAKVIFNVNEEVYLGQYIAYEFAKKATEEYWLIQDRTLIE